MKKYKILLLDLDGTLLYTLEDLADSLNHTLIEYGQKPHSLSDVKSFVGNGLRKLAIRALPDGENYPRFEEFFKDFVAYYNTHNRIKTRPYPLVLETLKELSNLEIKTAIVTNKGQAASDSLQRDFFKDISVVIGDDGTHQLKPNPEHINIALEKLDINDKSQVLYLGDSDVDAITAQNAGLDYVLCTYGFRDMETLKEFEPVAFIDSFDKILDFVDR
ncbi:MAG: HAD-IA family hydrolase [Pseudobutyrivibrio sp.]|nr:HAD-IA family hydrolase [Pseudobutyrivibrio sp.]